MIIGAPLTLVSTLPRREPNGLSFVDYNYEGELSAVMAFVNNLARDKGYSIDDSDAPKIRLRISDPNPTEDSANEEMAFHWEMPGTDESKSLLEHPEVISWPKKLQDSLRSRVQNTFDETYDERVAELTTAADTYLPTLPENLRRGLVVGFFNNILNEQSLLVPNYVLRLNQTVGSRYSKQISDVGVGVVHTTDQVKSEAEANNVPIPERIKYKIDNIKPKPNSSGIVVDADYGVNNFIWGWLKKNSTEQQIAGGRVEIQTEWVLDLWSELSYPADFFV